MTISPYTIRNTNGDVVATVNPATTTETTFPVEFPGSGYPIYGEFWNQNVYRLMENFSKSTPPSNPVPGMTWYNSTNKSQSYWDGAIWRPLLAANSANAIAFPMAVAANSVNLASAATTTIFTSAGSLEYYPTSLMLIPVTVSGTFTAPAAISLERTATEDIMETVILGNPTSTKFANYPMSGMVETVTGGQEIKLVVSSPMTGTGITALFKAIVFGHII